MVRLRVTQAGRKSESAVFHGFFQNRSKNLHFVLGQFSVGLADQRLTNSGMANQSAEINSQGPL